MCLLFPLFFYKVIDVFGDCVVLLLLVMMLRLFDFLKLSMALLSVIFCHV